MRSVGLLNSCENIILKVNKTTQGILIIPSNSREPESFKWLSEKAKVPRQMTCPEFTDTLYRAWGWDFSKRYRSTGRIVTVDNKVMLLFNFSTPFICNKDEKPANLVHKNVER
jgi:hypothetical protein